MKKNFIEELRWRRMLQEMIPGTEELVNKEMVTGYIGFDPTADSLGVGNLVQIMTLLHFQQCGHKPIALVGGATGMVGDPSGKSAERNLLDEATLQHNLSCQQKQLEKFLDFNCGENSAEIVNNYDWFKEISFLGFIRDIGKHITVNYMMAKESVKKRIAGDEREGMSFTEFSYQLIQGYDFYYLWKNKNVKMQMGGSDQLGNIYTGTELIRRKEGGDAWGLATPLIKKADGTKFGKTESGNIWLDPKRTSPYEFYQFWLNAADSDSENYIRIFTLKTKEEIENLEAEQKLNPGKRILQHALAKDITLRVHGEKALQACIEATELIFAKNSIEQLTAMGDAKFDQLCSDSGMPLVEISKADLEKGIGFIELMSDISKLTASRGDARKLIQNNGASVNKQKVNDPKAILLSDKLINNKYILLQKGKTDYCLVKAI